jgi:hypothetical protein
MSFGGGQTSPNYSTDDPTGTSFMASANYGSPQGILDYGSQAPSQYQGLFGNGLGLFGMSPQWQDFLYLMGAALKDRANGGRTGSFGNAFSRVVALNPRLAQSTLSPFVPSSAAIPPNFGRGTLAQEAQGLPRTSADEPIPFAARRTHE